MKQTLYDNKERLTSISIGLLLSNFIVAILIDQFQVPLHPNVIVTGSLLIAAVINKLVGRWMSRE